MTAGAGTRARPTASTAPGEAGCFVSIYVRDPFWRPWGPYWAYDPWGRYWDGYRDGWRDGRW